MLKHCTSVQGKDIRYDDEQPVVIIDNHVLRFSPAEYKVVYLLLNNEKVRDNDLAITLYQQETNISNKRSVKKYIYMIRSHLIPHGITILRIHGYGYTLQLAEKAALPPRTGNPGKFL